MMMRNAKKIKVLSTILWTALLFDQCSKPTEILKGPYVQNVQPDGITVMWESDRSVVGKVEYGETESLHLSVAEQNRSRFHEIHLTGLKPETRHFYRVISADAKSEIHAFRTAINKETPFSFALYGDNKSGPFMHEKIANLILSKEPCFVIHNGDLVDDGRIYKQWGMLFFHPARKLMHSIPLYPVLGNHESHADYFFKYFSLPHNENYYSFDLGNAHFIVFDSDVNVLKRHPEQLDWLVNDLENNTSTWTFVNFHHPPFTAGGNYYRADRVFRKNLLHPIFEKYGVDLVFSGHDHNYERTLPIVSKTGTRPVTYVVAGNGGTPMRYVGKRAWTLYAERVFGFVNIEIDGTKLHFQSITADDRVIDEFTLDKSDPSSIAAYTGRVVYFEDIIDPNEAIAFYKKGDDLKKEGKFDSAIIEFGKAHHVDTTCVEALGGMAECYYELGQSDKAMEVALMGINLMPNYPENYEVVIDIYRDRKQFDQALEWIVKWQAIEPDQADPDRTMAEIYQQQQMVNLAIEATQKALTIVPSDPALHVLLGDLYTQTGDRKNALSAYEEGLRWLSDENEDSEKKIRAKMKND